MTYEGRSFITRRDFNCGCKFTEFLESCLHRVSDTKKKMKEKKKGEKTGSKSLVRYNDTN